jgi:flagellar hook protein FlgE
MLRSMISAASALRYHQTFMDVVGNNIANVNTTAFKSGRVTFQEMMNQVLSSGSGPAADGSRGGINPVQIGLGMMIGGVDTLFTQGALQSTGRVSDLAIQGDGFFVFQGSNQQYYSRDGNLDVATDGTLVNPTTGFHVLGWQANANGVVNTAQPLGPITIPLGQGLTAKATNQLVMGGNLDASAVTGATSAFSGSVLVYDSLGNPLNVTLNFQKTGNDAWNVTVSETETAITGVTITPAALTFSTSGRLTGTTTLAMNLTLNNGAATPQAVAVDMSMVTQLTSSSEVALTSQNGVAAGALTGFNVTAAGEVVGIYSNGLRQTVGQIALATFRNPAGLIKAGLNLYAESPNTGERSLGVPGQAGRGSVTSGALEMSNVDLATQFTDMIRAQRGFQANSRIITASDQMLQELVNMGR